MCNKVDWKVELKSVAGMYEQYETVVKLWANENSTREELFNLACNKLKNGAFFDRNKSMWQIVSIEKIS